jgi:hypothetical protein
VCLIEGDDERLVEEIGEENSLWYRVVAQRDASVVTRKRCGNGFLPRGGVSMYAKSTIVVNYPG